MSAGNQYFHNIERAPHEFGYLLRALPAHFPVTHVMSADERLQAEAAIKHASNANFSLMNGIEAIGSLLFSAANNSEFPPSADVLENLGGLIRHIGVEAQFLQEQQADLQATLDRDDRRATTSPLRQKCGTKVAAAENGGAA